MLPEESIIDRLYALATAARFCPSPRYLALRPWRGKHLGAFPSAFPARPPAASPTKKV